MAGKQEFSIDDILSSLGAEKETNTKPSKVWSMDDIDALLGVGEPKKKEKSAESKDIKFVKKPIEEKEEVAEELAEEAAEELAEETAEEITDDVAEEPTSEPEKTSSEGLEKQAEISEIEEDESESEKTEFVRKTIFGDEALKLASAYDIDFDDEDEIEDSALYGDFEDEEEEFREEEVAEESQEELQKEDEGPEADEEEELPHEPVSQKTRVFSAKTVKVHKAPVDLSKVRISVDDDDFDDETQDDLDSEEKFEDVELEEELLEEEVENDVLDEDELEYPQENLFDASEDDVSEDDDSEDEEEETSSKATESTIIIELADEVPEESIEEKRALAGKTVGIYPVRNENIDHQILTEKVERSGGMETDKYRERFLNKPKQKLERTADYERLHPDGHTDPIERPGMIIKKSKFTNTADLEPIPTIISADAELNNFDKTIVANGDANTITRDEDDDFISGQMCLGGFGEEEEIEQIDEDSAEEKLKLKRDKKIASFRLDPDFADLSSEDPGSEEYDTEEDDAETETSEGAASDFIDDEFDYPSDAKRIRVTLSNAKRATAICGFVQAALTLVALIITGLVSTSGGNLELIGGSPLTCGVINIIILVLAGACGVNTLMRGVAGLKERKPNAATGTLLVVVACLLENIVIAFFTSDAYAPVSLFTAAGCLALTLANLSKWLVLVRTKGNFEFITNGTQLYSSEKIADEEDAFEIGRGLLMGEPEIRYSARITHPKKFIENSFEDDPADEFAEKTIPIIAGIALIAAVIYGIVEGDVVVAFGIFAAVCSIAIPAFTLISSNIALLFVNREYNRTGAAIIGHRAVKESTDINAYVLDSTDIFRKGTCSIIGIKTFHNMRIDDAILYAASLVVESGGPLGDVFGNVILGKRELLPPVESLAYEEKLGLSAWIHGRRVLVGSRDLLKNHNVEAPEREFEAQYTHDGRKVIYLAIAGKIAAMFVIQYHPDKHMRRYLQNVDKTGVSLLVRSCDCNITEEMICHHFNLPTQAVKVLSPVSGDIFQKYRKENKDDAQAGILHNGTIEASLKTIYEAGELHANIPVNNIVALAYSVMAFILFVIMSVLSGPTGVTGAQVVAFQILWGAIAAAIPVLKRKFDK